METVGTFMKWHAMQGRSGQKQKTKECKSADIVAQLTWRAKFLVEKIEVEIQHPWALEIAGLNMVSDFLWS